MKTVLTGAGIVSTAGHDLDSFWSCLKNGNITYGCIPELQDDKNYRIKICAKIMEETWREPECRESEYGRAANYAVAAAVRAIRHAGLQKHELSRGKTAIVIGTTMGEIQQEEMISRREAERGLLSIPDMEFKKYDTGRIGVAVGRALSASGPLFTVPAACAAGNYAVWLGKRLIEWGMAQVAIVGGVDVLSRVAFTGFQRLLSLTPDLCRPFDRNRGGIVIGEGCGMLVMENSESAAARGAHVLAEVAGAGLASDCYHMTSPHPEGSGAVRAMKQALDEARAAPGEIDYISAHATGTAANDKIESLAMRKVFGDGKIPPVSSIKSMLGHSMGAASALELVACLQMMERGVILPTVNYRIPDPECPVDCVPNIARNSPLDCVMSNSFAFGGQASSVILKKAG